MKIGHGYDAHRLIEGSGMILGGVTIACNYSIDAHSDGDLIPPGPGSLEPADGRTYRHPP